jgi:hypothetical protein
MAVVRVRRVLSETWVIVVSTSPMGLFFALYATVLMGVVVKDAAGPTVFGVLFQRMR